MNCKNDLHCENCTSVQRKLRHCPYITKVAEEKCSGSLIMRKKYCLVKDLTTTSASRTDTSRKSTAARQKKINMQYH